jgi:hypothetical protein
LVNTRAADIDGAHVVQVDEVAVGEARLILLGPHLPSAPTSVVDAADDLADLLGRWALLVSMAAALVRDDLGGPPDRAVAALENLAAEFRADPTVLDDEEARERSFARLVDRSEASLRDRAGDAHRDVERFWHLGVYPAHATLEVELLADLWACTGIEARRTARRIAEAGLATMLPPTDTRGPALTLHDLIVDYLHRHHCRPGQYPYLHRRCLAPAIGADGQPGAVTQARAAWLVHHLACAGEWSLLEHLATPRWRAALLQATGSDGALLDSLTAYAHAALHHLDGPHAAYHYFTSILFAVHVRALIGEIPIAVLTTTALLGNPLAALTQAARHPDAAQAVPAV